MKIHATLKTYLREGIKEHIYDKQTFVMCQQIREKLNDCFKVAFYLLLRIVFSLKRGMLKTADRVVL